VIGLLLIVLAVYSVVLWWTDELYVVVKALLPVFVALVGLVFILLSFE